MTDKGNEWREADLLPLFCAQIQFANFFAVNGQAALLRQIHSLHTVRTYAVQLTPTWHSPVITLKFSHYTDTYFGPSDHLAVQRHRGPTPHTSHLARNSRTYAYLMPYAYAVNTSHIPPKALAEQTPQARNVPKLPTRLLGCSFPSPIFSKNKHPPLSSLHSRPNFLPEDR